MKTIDDLIEDNWGFDIIQPQELLNLLIERCNELKFKYLTKEEQEMEEELALLQIAIGLQSCTTKGDVVKLFKEAGRLITKNELMRLGNLKESDLK